MPAVHLDDARRANLAYFAEQLEQSVFSACGSPHALVSTKIAIAGVVLALSPDELPLGYDDDQLAAAAFKVLGKPRPVVASWYGIGVEVLDFARRALAGPVDVNTQRTPDFPRVRRYEREGFDLNAAVGHGAHCWPVMALFGEEPGLERVAVLEHGPMSCTIVTVGYPLPRHVAAAVDAVVCPGHSVEYSHRGVLLDGVREA